jgi:hypothetical protein
MPKRITGFMALAKSIIESKPGISAQEVVSIALQYSDREGIPLSAATSPEASLSATLHKAHKDYGLERERGADGTFRYYPEGQVPADPIAYRFPSGPNSPVSSDHSKPSTGHHGDSVKQNTQPEGPLDASSPTVSTQTHSTREISKGDEECCTELPVDLVSKIRALVELGRYPNEHEAHSDLVKEGLRAVLARPLT